MLRIRNGLFLCSVLAMSVGAGCSGDEPEGQQAPFTSREATLLDFAFKGELVTGSSWNIEQTIEDQMLYTIGHLNGDNSVGRLDALKITDIETTRQDDGSNLVKYSAVLPVGWGSKENLPESYKFTMPRRMDHSSLEEFTTKYSHSCVDWGAHDVDQGSMWYYYRPGRSGCELAPEDVVTFEATVTKSPDNSSGKYPEYHMVWEDEALTVVAIFGKYEDGATSSSDAGISAYNNFISAIRSELPGAVLTPSDVPNRPGVEMPDITVNATLTDGRTVTVNALLVDNVRTAGPTFNNRYESLSADADLIFYNGHAGLGANIRALAQKGEFKAGKYQIFFMNGCDTFAYVDNALSAEKARLNEDDPNGTKYLDVMTNVMPSFFREMPNGSMALIKGLLSYDAPLTYEDIFANIDSDEVVVVTGETDNVFSPGGPVEVWELNERGSVQKGESVDFTTGVLPAGEYLLSISEDQEAPGGDADLYIGLGYVPTTESYDERPWLDGSNEEVRITLAEATEVHIMVHGYESANTDISAFILHGQAITE